MFVTCGRVALRSLPKSARQIFNASSHALCSHAEFVNNRAAANAQASAICIRLMHIGDSKQRATDVVVQPCGDVPCATEAIRHAWHVVTQSPSSVLHFWRVLCVEYGSASGTPFAERLCEGEEK